MTENSSQKPTIQTLFSLEGRVALVTGSAQGLGYEIAKVFAQAGAQVVINSRDPDRAVGAVERLAKEDLDAIHMAFDVTDERASEKAISTIADKLKRLDILVNNAGLRHRANTDEISGADFLDLMDTNVKSPFTLSKKAADLMIPRRYGRIINITSIAGISSRSGNSSYAASKGGLAALTRAFACEYGQYGITVNSIAPGSFNTEYNQTTFATPDVGEWIKKRVPLGRWGEAHEISGAALFLASEAGSYVNGHELVVDGGFTISL